MALLDREESGYDHAGKIIKSQLGESEFFDSDDNDNKNMVEDDESSFANIMALLDETEEREYNNDQYDHTGIPRSQFDMTESDSDDSTEDKIEEEEASVTGIIDLLEKDEKSRYSKIQYDHIDIIKESQLIGESEIDNSDGIMEEEGEKDDLFISDAEALLACWGHLKRRKLTSVQDVLLACSIADDIYESRTANDVDMDNAIMTGDLADIDTFTATGGTTKIWNDNTNYNKEYDKDDSWYKEFTSFPTEPSDSRIRRVNAIKKRWEDPTYRERWYQKRWGSLSNHQKKNQQQTVREQKAIIRARDLPSEFLGSDELALMEEDEIANAL
ncbi:hypothetical protein FRACYDRAFT_247561 [Fragilariopsis cylindrus CCMP1102]|uniref:Uncharacterized protein n=1 Tax=Fragilariopsis cylindrus CCMP1102 TaxID=635003 RepID=A0A1E7EVV6_9STRA|nr:hypothetical protein FRACYDRAFT_247561 [Fragilariopsis cylindrus CCMP1102]|eukprot:OEU09954.1 hypothetical protein FRACYDRAFT_247561 [Fragilariopsis cylindrus CCMP1102]